MNELGLDSFEKSIQSNIKSIKPKSKRRGYARELVEKLHPTIERALANGCSYEEIAEAISSKNVRIASSTLKKYHRANKKIDKTNSKPLKELGNLDASKFDSKINKVNSSIKSSSGKLPVREQSLLVSEPIASENPGSIPQILSGASLTDEDYLEDFNDY